MHAVEAVDADADEVTMVTLCAQLRRHRSTC